MFYARYLPEAQTRFMGPTVATAEVPVPDDVLRLQHWSRLGIAMGHGSSNNSTMPVRVGIFPEQLGQTIVGVVQSCMPTCVATPPRHYIVVVFLRHLLQLPLLILLLLMQLLLPLQLAEIGPAAEFDRQRRNARKLVL